MKRISLMLLALTFFVMAPALAQNESAGGAADNGASVQQPWTFTAFDENGDGFLTPGEFGTGLFEFISGDPAGIAQDRYEGAIETFGLTDTTDFEMADVNGDGVVTDDQEFTPAIATGLFEQWDEDGDDRLSAQEFSSNMLGAFDTNADGTFDDQEFEEHAEWFETGATEVAGGGGAEGGFGEEFFLGEQVGPGVNVTEEQDIGGPGDEDEGDAGQQ